MVQNKLTREPSGIPWWAWPILPLWFLGLLVWASARARMGPEGRRDAL